jgi:glycerophosphoryl diester phosphodiesterase
MTRQRPRQRPRLLGHRGARASVSVSENTLASFDLCLQHGCDGFEFDVRGTRDGVPVVCHDASFRGLGLSGVDAGDLSPWQAQGFLPTLEEVLRRYSPLCFLDIEIKDAGFETRVLELLGRYAPRHGYVVTSFLPPVLLRLHELDATVELGFLWDRPNRAWRELPVSWALPAWGLLDARLGPALKEAGKRIGVWTVNRPADMIRLADSGAEILISDDTVGLVNAFAVG